jgi:hypothetical protein
MIIANFVPVVQQKQINMDDTLSRDGACSVST